ncbi:hypothetical protein BWQ96_09421 [Gracilariopsis chorda]|uniref:Uncharacterized protein n=1 Tax=Gracilariopsis chorda TaxID=448386 RepID=A0A2V3II89_9FLOR|nr:hypothetical protein BWQ96_09421 [Gracilariopsis chorda]|eukprot:PXF40860.1 hypothetical protein BWQ96_09421 [Gracilariopsis chorda]
MSQLKEELAARKLPSTRSAVLILLMDDMPKQGRTWMNERICLQGIDKHPVEMEDLYRYVAVLLSSHLTGLSFEKIIGLFGELNFTVPAIDRV